MCNSNRNPILTGVLALLFCLPAGYVFAESPTYETQHQHPWAPATDQTRGVGDSWKLPDIAANRGGSGAPEKHELYRMTPEELNDRYVFGSDDKTIGKIKKIVSDRANGGLYAVISSGGIFGLGATETVVSLDRLVWVDQQLQLDTTRSELMTRDDYSPDRYLDVQPDDRPVSEFSAFEVEIK